MITRLTSIIFLLTSILSTSLAQFHPDSLIHIEVAGNTTNSWINGDLGKKHQVFYNPTSTSNNSLLLHLVGTIDNPNSTTYFPTMATENGFHVINLMYRNWTSAQSACAMSTDPDCYLNFRKEIIEGVDYSTEANVNAANSIENRLLKLLEYLHSIYPTHGWNEYYTGTTIHWEKLIVSGHSQGGGHAAVIGLSRPVQRVLMFASPNDYSDTLNTIAAWTSDAHVVADSNYYGFNAYYDDVVEFWQQMQAWDALNLDNLGDTVNVDQSNSPYNNSRQLYTKQSSSTASHTHNLMIRDAQTPIDMVGTGEPIFLPVWQYMLGVDDTTLEVTTNSGIQQFEVFPNPASNEVRIKYETTPTTTEVFIYSLSGQLCEKYLNKQTVKLNDYPSGLYFIEVRIDGKYLGKKKLVIE